MIEVNYRSGTPDDSRRVFEVFIESVADLDRRQGTDVEADDFWAKPEAVPAIWERRKPLFDYLEDAAHFWLAERDGEVIGYARSTVEDGLLELTEFFVRPGRQSAGVGAELLRRAFPQDGARRRVIIATTDVRAQARYLKSGVAPRFTVMYFTCKPEAIEVASDLVIEPVADREKFMHAAGRIDKAVLDYRRDSVHEFVLSDRLAFQCRRGDRIVGYAYTGKGTGPIAVEQADDMPAVLAHLERLAAERGDQEFGMQVPTINHVAVEHLFGRGCRLDPFVILFMADRPFGKFENYILSSPPFFM